ncbi:hypothetical protein O181_027552 [Austropuccinia psidii MF-1]|uniref:Mitochondrial protein n=1 Tax=Austropuccinia psidii MF-1 TaxID=1389203 RepID=A0A9Q3CQ85_9BASI|nr:hypothetical protein [Austropuccinia psidii MF-1]
MTTLKLPISRGLVLVHDVVFSNKISGTILSVGHLCTAGVVPVFDDLELSLFVCGFLVTTTFNNNCWWLDISAEEGTKRSAAVSPSCVLPKIEMHPISKPTSTSLSSRNRQIQSASIVFPHFQSSNNTPTGCVKGLLFHIVNAATLGQVPTECYFKNELKAIDTLSVTKDIVIPKHLGQALSGPLQHDWKRAYKAELVQMTLRDVWEAVDKDKMMKTIGHHWVFNIKHHADRTIENTLSRKSVNSLTSPRVLTRQYFVITKLRCKF